MNLIVSTTSINVVFFFAIYQAVNVWLLKVISKKRIKDEDNGQFHIWRQNYLFEGILTVQEGLIFDDLDEVASFQSHPAVPPQVP